MEYAFVPLNFERRGVEESRARVRGFLETIRSRRTVRDYAPDPVPLDITEAAIAAAASAPSGANRLPWKFVVVRDPEVKPLVPDIKRKTLAEVREIV